MQSVDLIIARHGDTVWPGRCRGSASDPELSWKGWEQSARAFNVFQRERCPIVFTSSLTRAACVASLAVRERMRQAARPELNAIHAGMWEGVPWKDIATRWPEELRRCNEDAEHLVTPGGNESVQEFGARTLRALQRIGEDAIGKIRTLGIVTHGCLLSWHVGKLEGRNTLTLRDRRIPTGSLHRLRFTDNGLELLEVNFLDNEDD